MLKDYVEKYYFEGNYNCAETIVHAANECYQLHLDDRSIKLVGGFGAGIQTGNLCGALLGAVSVLSMKYVEAKAHESSDIKPVVTLLLERFQNEFEGKTLCNDVKPMCFQPEIRCLNTVCRTCDILEKVIEEYEAVK